MLLQRKTAGINVTLQNEDGSSLATSIDSVRVYVGNLAEKVNAYNGNYENYTKTVMIPLTISGTQVVNKTAMVLPSDVPPYFRVEIDLKNGGNKKYETHLFRFYLRNKVVDNNGLEYNIFRDN